MATSARWTLGAHAACVGLGSARGPSESQTNRNDCTAFEAGKQGLLFVSEEVDYGLELDPDNESPRHANIVGWPKTRAN